MLALLSSIKEDCIGWLAGVPVKGTPDEVKTATAIQGAELRFAILFLNLPGALKKFEEQLELQEAQKEKMVAAREGGEL